MTAMTSPSWARVDGPLAPYAGGFRVELGEVRAVVDSHPGVVQAVVVAYETGLVSPGEG